MIPKYRNRSGTVFVVVAWTFTFVQSNQHEPVRTLYSIFTSEEAYNAYNSETGVNSSRIVRDTEPVFAYHCSYKY